MAREDFGQRPGIDEVKDDSPRASIVGIAIPVLVLVAAAAAYFFVGSDNQFSRVQVTPPATQQEAPKVNPDANKVSPQSEQKAPPAADKKPNDTRDPRSDSQNSN